MVCPHCGTKAAAQGGQCTGCGRRIPPGSVAAATLTPSPSNPPVAPPPASSDQTQLAPESIDQASASRARPAVAGRRVRPALPHHPAARRRRHGRRLSGLGRRARRGRRAEGHSAGSERRSRAWRRRWSAGSSANCCSPARSRTRTSSAFTTSAKSTASSTSRCRTSRARDLATMLKSEGQLPVPARCTSSVS